MIGKEELYDLLYKPRKSFAVKKKDPFALRYGKGESKRRGIY